MPIRSVAVIRLHNDHPPSRHFVGIPEGAGGTGSLRLPWPKVVLIVERPDGLYLERYTDRGDLVGDTEHEDVVEAREQAECEYGSFLGEWKDVPDDVPDEQIVLFAQHGG
jgi:hypothetical protein